MKTALLATLAAAGLLSASPAALSQNTKFYAGGSIGQAKTADWCTGAPSTVSCDDKDTAWKIFGGYQFHPNFAVELGYADLGSVKASGSDAGVTFDITGKQTAWDLTGVASWPLANRFAVFGRLGLYYGESKGSGTVSFGGVSGSGSVSDTNTDFTFGLGASYNLTSNAGLRVEWQRYNDMGGDNVGKSNVDVLSIGALYRF
jgi:OOP family OmpA-OmpF porin